MVRKGMTRIVMSMVALALAFVAALPVTAFAANTGNTDFALVISGSAPTGSTEHTHFRNKIDNTPSYAIASAFTTTGTFVGISGIDSYSLDYHNRTVNGYAWFRNLNQHSTIRNTVYENNEFFAWFWLYKGEDAPTNSATYVQGEWSPDSTAVFTVINEGF